MRFREALHRWFTRPETDAQKELRLKVLSEPWTLEQVEFEQLYTDWMDH